jgi:hypothetical protein
MKGEIRSLNKWQCIENHYAAWNISENKSSATECLKILEEFVFEDGIPLTIFGTGTHHRWWLRILLKEELS